MISSDKIIQTLESKFPDTIKKASSTSNIVQLRTGVFTVDLLTGGIPLNKFTVLWGPKSSGKSTLSYKIIDSYFKATEYKCVYVDFEKGFNKAWAEKFITNMDRLILFEPLYGEHGVDSVYELAQADDIGLIVIDSVAMIFSINEVEASSESNFVGPSARLIRQLFNKLLVAMSQAKQNNRLLTVLIINQVRANIGAQKFASQTRMPGGKIIDHLTSLTLKLYHKSYKTVDGFPRSSIHSFTVEKNRLGLPKMSGEFVIDLINGKVEDEKPILEYAKRYNLLSKNKKSFSLLGETRTTLKELKKLLEDEDFKNMVVKAIINQYHKELYNAG